MDIRDNIRLNRTKMLDEAAINHRPSHFMHSFLIFLLVYFIASMVASILSAMVSAIHLFQSEVFWEMIFKVTEGTISSEQAAGAIEAIINTSPWWVSAFSLFATGASFIGATIIYCKFIEKRTIASVGLRKTNYVLEYGMGAIIGIVMYALTVLVALACGSVEFIGEASFSYPIILFLVAFVIQGAGEELLVRGYLMTSVARDYKVGLALAFSAAVFSLLHASNSGVTGVALINIFLFGVFEGIYILKRGDIIGACAIHTMWNFVQGCVFGSSVSGMAKLPSIFTLASNGDMVAANGGTFGLEGGFSATVVLLVSIGLLLLVTPKRSELPDYELARLSSEY